MLLPAEIKQRIIDRLNEGIPRPKLLVGKVVLTLEFNFQPDGTIREVNIETNARESLWRK